jgi:hypothetical protein
MNGGNGPRARWEDVIDIQIRLLDLVRIGRLGFPQDPQVFKTLPPFLPDALIRAEPMYVSSDVFEAWQFAYAAFEPESIRPDDLLTRSALVLLPRPIEFLRAGTDKPATAILWGPVASHSPGNTENVFVAGFTLRGVHDWAMSSMMMIPLDNTPEQVLREAAKLPNWMENVSDEDQKLLRQWQIMQAFWRMARSFVSVPERASRAGRRAAKRANLEREHVTVIQLRRQRHELPESERQVDWQCRWMVRGHWRRLHGGRQTWVMPYVKGPDDKPFRVTDRVWEFVR